MATDPTDKLAQDAALHRELARLQTETIDRLEHDPAAQAWLAQFYDNGSLFLTHYADKRADYLMYGPGWRERFEKEAAKAEANGLERLWQIQQLKLFRAQCAWRAEQLTLPAEWVEVSQDFRMWSERIHECPFIDPITPEDIEQYLAYLDSDECQDTDPEVMSVRSWQFYDKYRTWREAEERGDDPVDAMLGPKSPNIPDFFHYGMLAVFRYPEWYHWADDHLHHLGNWLLLPDVRGAKEHYYEQLGKGEATPPPAAPPPPAPAPPAAPRLPELELRDRAMTETLLRRFEPPEMLQYYRAMEEDDDDDDARRKRRDRHTNRARQAIADLDRLGQALPIRAAPDWRKAVVRVWRHHARARAIADVRTAYAAYQRREAAGDPHPAAFGDFSHLGITQDHAAKQRAAILLGRAAAGEPADFNF